MKYGFIFDKESQVGGGEQRSLIYRSSLIKFSFIMGMTLAMNACSGFTIKQDLKIEEDAHGNPIALENAPDGDFIIGLDGASPTILKIDSKGSKLWAFNYRRQDSSYLDLRMVQPTTDGGAILCGDRHSVGNARSPRLSSLVIKLDANGRESLRLDPLNSPITGGEFFNSGICAPWGEGFILLAASKAPDATPEQLRDPTFNGNKHLPVLMYLRKDLSVMWRKDVIVDPGPLSKTNNRVRELRSGDILIQSFDNRLFIIDRNGAIYAQTKERGGFCTLLSSTLSDNRIRYVCTNESKPDLVDIIELDESLRVIHTASLRAQMPWGYLSALPDGRMVLGGSDDRHAAVHLYSSGGELLGTHKWYALGGGSIYGMVPVNGGSYVAALRDSFGSDAETIYWVLMDPGQSH